MFDINIIQQLGRLLMRTALGDVYTRIAWKRAANSGESSTQKSSAAGHAQLSFNQRETLSEKRHTQTFSYLRISRTKDGKRTNVMQSAGQDIALLHSCLKLDFVERAFRCNITQTSRTCIQSADSRKESIGKIREHGQILFSCVMPPQSFVNLCERTFSKNCLSNAVERF